MCYRVLTCNVEILVWLYNLILWKRKKKKDLLQFELSKRKNLQVPWDVFLMFWTLLDLGRTILNVKDKKNNMVYYGTNLKTLTSLPNRFKHSANNIDI